MNSPNYILHALRLCICLCSGSDREPLHRQVQISYRKWSNETTIKLVSWGEARKYGFKYFLLFIYEKFTKRIYERTNFGFYFMKNLRNYLIIS